MKLAYTLVAFLILGATVSFGQDTAAKRTWLKQYFVNVMSNNPQQLQSTLNMIDRMNAQQIDALVLNAQQQQQIAYQNWLLQQQRQQYGGVAYAPQVTWLPSGASMGAGAVVSPGGRNVRMNLSPMFSSIPQVQTYNLQTGQTRTYRNPAAVGGVPSTWDQLHRVPSTWDGR